MDSPAHPTLSNWSWTVVRVSQLVLCVAYDRLELCHVLLIECWTVFQEVLMRLCYRVYRMQRGLHGAAAYLRNYRSGDTAAIGAECGSFQAVLSPNVCSQNSLNGRG